jgi:uncharacterized protein (TIGR04562 family)
MITDISDLLLMASHGNSDVSEEDALWAEVILKVMHTILHVDKDLRSNYFNAIQTQIFDRFYKYIFRDDKDELYIATTKGDLNRIPLIDFETKSKKSRDSVIIKLLHKVENVAEELFDRVGVRIVTHSKFDTIRVVKFLIENYIVIPHNIKPSRSLNTLVNIEQDFRDNYSKLIKQDIKSKWTEEQFLEEANKLLSQAESENNEDEEGRNKHTLSKYRSIQFTGRQLIKYKNPFWMNLVTFAKRQRTTKRML